jgi:transcriptional regulator with XRE-family HTH domain
MPTLRDYRLAAGLTQQEAAAAAGCTQGMISRIEGGEPASIPLLRRLGDAYSLPREAAVSILRQHGAYTERLPGGVIVCRGCGVPVDHIGGPCDERDPVDSQGDELELIPAALAADIDARARDVDDVTL